MNDQFEKFLQEVVAGSVGPGEIFDLGDELGLTQCTRLRTSGDPKGIVRKTACWIGGVRRLRVWL
jgi:hypothetical protein